MLQTKYFLLYLLICILSRTTVAAPPQNQVVNPPPVALDISNSQPAHPQQKHENSSIELKPKSPENVIAVKNDKIIEPNPNLIPPKPKEGTKPKIKNETSIVAAPKYIWKDMRNNETLTRFFNKTLLNETVVPLLKKCDSISDKQGPLNSTDKRNLCPVYFDNLMSLNSTATSINSTELTDFILTSSKDSKFCENIFSKNVKNYSTYVNYTKSVTEIFSKNMDRACYNLCYENPGDEVATDTCAIIAFMGHLSHPPVQSEKEVNKKTVEEEPIPVEDEEKMGPFQNDDEEDYQDVESKNKKDDESISQNEKNLLEEENKPVNSPAQHAEIVDDHVGSFSSHPISPNIVIDEPDPSSMKYFAFATLILCVVYFGWHYRSKILGLIVEGRRSQRGRGGGRGRKHTAAYRKLDSNLEEAINSSTSSRSNSQIIY